MKKTLLTFILVLVLTLLPILMLFGFGFLVPSQFDNTFNAELPEKIKRLDSIKENKVVIIGGSSVAFGIDSKLLESQINMPVVNFGLYASLGTKVMLDLSKEGINAGDIVIISPEFDSQLYSLFYGADDIWASLDGNFKYLSRLGKDNRSQMVGTFFKFVERKMKYAISSDYLDPSGVYNKKSFNEYGDIIYPNRKYNIMDANYDISKIISLNPDFISKDFISYVNEYTKEMENKGAKVYISFCPINRAALVEGTNKEDVNNLMAFFSENFKCEVLGNVNSYIYKSGYFYDSNFHMNETGVILHTRQVALDLLSVLDNVNVNIEKPDEPERPTIEDIEVPYDENEKYFIFEEKDGIYYIIGTSEEGKNKETLTTPKGYNGKAKIAISKIDSEILKELYVTDNIIYIMDKAFEKSSSLKKIHILSLSPDNTHVNSMGYDLLIGLPNGFKFYVPNSSIGDYKANYFWGTYSDYIVGE